MPITLLHRYLVGMLVLFFWMEPALAGPGGAVAKAAFETLWGRVALALLVVFFLPIIVYVVVSEKLAERRARRDLAFVAAHDERFAWTTLKARATACFHRIHAGWQDGDISTAQDWMTSWYWQNQQSVYLDRWQTLGLVNVCKVKKIRHIRPLMFAHKNSPSDEHEGSQVVVSISATMQDYLHHVVTGKIVEGSKRWKTVETLWTLTLSDGEWRVSMIEEDSLSFEYAKLRSELPAIEHTMAGRMSS